ncbi:hypothetical protein IGJ02_000138 [Enterococcus sp. DIV0724b]|uniref:LytR/AlgR family response regulator transcription factor n=1 Tax=Enterococcus sp. DIV0724b TaxID=2774694 RepID=UPI003D2FAC75
MRESISIYIVEDQLAYRKELQKFIDSLEIFNNHFLLKVHSLDNFITFYEELDYLDIKDNDIILLDIDLQMSFSGIHFAKKIRKKNKQCFILFLTNMENKGIEIINQNINATSYILKGNTIDTGHLKNLFISLKSEIDSRIQNTEGYLSLKKNNETIYIKYEKILYIQSVTGIRNMLLVKTINSEQIVDGSINKLKKEVQSNYLYTDLRSFIINLTRIASLNYLLGLVVFDDGTELEVGEKIVYKLKKALI